MKFLIAGLGSIGRRHLQNLIVLGEPDIILFRTGHSTLSDEGLEGFPIETNFDTALSYTPDAVIISNPTSLHLDIAIPAVKAGCDIFLEKPVSNSLDRIDKLNTAVKSSKVQVLVGYQFRYHPGMKLIRRLIEKEAIGRLLYIHAHWGEYLPGWHPWEDYRGSYSARSDLGGGVVLTLSHPIDYMRWLMGEITEVWAITCRSGELDIQVEDLAEIGFRFDNGALGSLHLDYIQRPNTHRLEIIGTKGTIQWDYNKGETRLFQINKDDWVTYSNPEKFERNHMFLSQMGHFLEVVKRRAKPLCTLEDGVKVVQIALAIHSSQTQKKVIHV